MPFAHISEIVKVHPPKLRVVRTNEVRFLRGIWHKLKSHKAGRSEVQTITGNELRLVNSWLRNGARADLTVDKAAMGEAPEGSLFRIDFKGKKLERVESSDAPGFYLKRGQA